MKFRPAEVLEELWREILAERHDERERKRIEHADRIRHALTVLESVRNWNLEHGKGRA